MILSTIALVAAIQAPDAAQTLPQVKPLGPLPAGHVHRKVSDNPTVDEAEPEARIDCLHHAREPQGM